MLADCHVHFGPDTDINKENWETRADYNFVTATSFDTESTNKKLLDRQSEKFKCFWWYDGNPIPSNSFGVKYHGAYLKKPIDAFDPNLVKFEHFLIHCGMYLNGSSESDTSYRHALNFASFNPQAKIILAHMGGSINPIIKKVIRDSQSFDNVWLDTSGITNPLIVEYAVKNFREDRIMFGSDIPWCSFDSQLYNVLDADITKKQKEMILCENLLEFIQ